MQPTQQVLIDGQWLSGDAEAFTKLDPITGAELWQGKAASAEQVTRAVASARQAFPAWAMTSLDEREALVERFRGVLESRELSGHRDRIADPMLGGGVDQGR